jgi:hypothetical protein
MKFLGAISGIISWVIFHQFCFLEAQCDIFEDEVAQINGNILATFLL